MDEAALVRWDAAIRRDPKVHDCCKEPENLVVSEDRGDTAVRICKVCGRRHYYLRADPGKLISRGY